MNEIRGGLYYRTLTLTAGKPITLNNLRSKLIHIFKANNPVGVSIDGDSEFIEFVQGVGFSYDDTNDEVFNILTLLSSTTQEITFFYGVGNINDFRATVEGVVSFTHEADNVLTPYEDNSIAGNSAELVSSANSAKKTVGIKNPISNTNAFKIGNVDVSSTKGISLEVGQTMVIETSAGVYAHNLSSSAQSIEVMESSLV